MKIQSLESYAHKAAKEVFAGWLRDLAREAGHGNDAILGTLCWEVNRWYEPFGVWLEYPILRSKDNGRLEENGIDIVWDEVPHDDGPSDDWPGSPWEKMPPTFEHLVKTGEAPEIIVDIAVQQTGSITHAIEVVHKNPPSGEKIKKLQSIGVDLWVIPTRWILGQVGRPTHIPAEFRIL